MNIRIIQTPAGEAPENVRAAWVGLILPVAGPQRLVTLQTSGVMTGPKGFIGGLFALLTGRTKAERGYLVEGRVAVDILSRHSPEAAAWWNQNTPHLLRPGRNLMFQEAACVVEESSTTG